jgi:hypothetical protein
MGADAPIPPFTMDAAAPKGAPRRLQIPKKSERYITALAPIPQPVPPLPQLWQPCVAITTYYPFTKNNGGFTDW